MQRIRERNKKILGREAGAIIKPRADRLRIVLAYPGEYRIGMANLGFQTVYRLFNEYPDVVCERAFYPDASDLERHRKKSIPIISIESQDPISEFDVVAFSIPFENDATKLVEMLSLSKIPLYSNRRTRPSGKSYPLIMAGGITVTMNPEPFAPFIDAAAIGEAEAVIPALVKRLAELRKKKEPRAKWPKAITDLTGIYVPGLYRVTYADNGRIEKREALSGAPERVKRAYLKDLAGCRVRQQVFAPGIEFDDMGLVEIARGCGRACRFCAEGYLYRPPRPRPSRDVIKDIEEIFTQREKVGLIAPVVSDFPVLVKVIDFIRSKRGKLSVSSLRADALSDTLIKALADSGSRTVTLAPETGNGRLRRVLNKPVSDKVFIDAARRLARAGIPRLKLYFLVGLPLETMEDVNDIPALVRKILGGMAMASGKKRFPGEVHVSVNPFVPKPWTPFQWHEQEGVKTIKEKISVIRSELRRNPEVRMSVESPREAEVQGLITRGDRRVAAWIEKAVQNQGNWTRTIREEGIPLDFYLYRPRYEDEILPWDFIDTGVKRKFLMEEYHRGMNRDTTRPCPPDAYLKPGKCRACGVC